jgi:hypothetical protein
VLTIAAAVTIALLFQPLRHRAQLFANRFVYGKRATPYQALSDFAGDMVVQLDLTEAVERMVSVLAGATGADRAEAWIRVGTQLRPAAGAACGGCCAAVSAATAWPTPTARCWPSRPPPDLAPHVGYGLRGWVFRHRGLDPGQASPPSQTP